MSIIRLVEVVITPATAIIAISDITIITEIQHFDTQTAVGLDSEILATAMRLPATVFIRYSDLGLYDGSTEKVVEREEVVEMVLLFL